MSGKDLVLGKMGIRTIEAANMAAIAPLARRGLALAETIPLYRGTVLLANKGLENWPKGHEKSIRVCAHSIFWAQNGCGFRVQFSADYPFFGMEILRVSIDTTEFFDVVFKTAVWKTRKGLVNS